NFRQFWNGRAKTLEEQIDGPVQNPKEMGAVWEDVLRKLQSDPAYSESFGKIYGDGISRDNVKNAIATFERALVTTNSRFDRF
ncbi:cytochrome-c peroxidase, partial [Acinetobacter baumannii]